MITIYNSGFTEGVLKDIFLEDFLFFVCFLLLASLFNTNGFSSYNVQYISSQFRRAVTVIFTCEKIVCTALCRRAHFSEMFVNKSTAKRELL